VCEFSATISEAILQSSGVDAEVRTVLEQYGDGDALLALLDTLQPSMF
jgi:hypothetical protein